MRSTIGLLLVLVGMAGPVQAGELKIFLKTTDDKVVVDAVVTVHPGVRHKDTVVRFPWPMVIEQRDLKFQPFVLIAPTGAEVAFPNFDDVKHHVYSLSKSNPFELRLFGKDESRHVRMINPGIVAIGCNIHDQMSAFIAVVDTAFAAKSDASGAALIEGIPDGPATVRVWHPFLHADDSQIERTVNFGSNAETMNLELDVRTPHIRHHTY